MVWIHAVSGEPVYDLKTSSRVFGGTRLDGVAYIRHANIIICILENHL